jgi:6-phosphofructokinase 2
MWNRMIACLSLNPALDLATSTAKVVPTSKLRCSPPRLDPGGGGLNVARVIQTLGGDAVALFPVGGHTGAKLVELVQGLELPHRAIPIAGATRESLTVEEGESGLQYRFVLPGPELTDEELARCADALTQLQPRPSHFVATGSLPPGAPADFYARICRTARELGMKTVLDTSGPALHAAYAGLSLMKPSLSELEEIAGARLATMAERIAAARDIVGRGSAEVVVVSLGGDGALWVTEDAHEHLPPIPVQPRSAVGAGDSMVAAITLGLANDMPLRDAVRFGMAAGAATVMTPGTELCRREDVESLYSSAYRDAVPNRR